MTAITVDVVRDFDALGRRWQALERRASVPIFRSWTWTGCLAEERFHDPVLVEATESGRTIALALFNRVRSTWGQPDRLYLSESGNPSLDCIYVEHNGVLAEQGREAELTRTCLAAVARGHVLVLSGVGTTELHAARVVAGRVWIGKDEEAPCIDLDAVRRTGDGYLASISANTRQQIRRSDRSYGAPDGLSVRIAASAEEAHAMLDRMAALHQATWIARGRPGSFAEPFFGRFHHALIDRGIASGQVMLMELRGRGRPIGVLYTLRDASGWRAYQSGFDYAVVDPRAKPGLTCHHAAIGLALREGAARYDFLAGGDRYKRSLANASVRQYWLEAGPGWAPRLLRRRLADAIRRR
ncbi:GNAT family N-acetyltransferase [Rhodopila sp.]|uniref:GNAT family N-acetyltransferase n=1 Tax=Rhodopila sp. TaxID=2480087 RepID=UPI002C6C03E0|nr:GNAT family N-acetyltransferase [Rhodopila sp.]HVZ06460.1 GNAT family N-acetyltransferase [Rhodopila sp.]